jgi:uncharacterized surface protein with fasciclin (FAS1) repeats
MHFRSAASDAPQLHSLSAPGITLRRRRISRPCRFRFARFAGCETAPIASSRITMNSPNITPQAVPQNTAAPKTNATTSAAMPASAQTKNLLDTAAAQGSFSTFAKAVEQAGLSETLGGAGPFTVFAPTDAAFAKLPAGKLDTLMKPENKDQLASILKYHVLAGRKNVVDMGKWDTAKTVNGQAAPIRMLEGKFSIDGAYVTNGDIASSNGVIHGIDKVNLPTATA